MRGDIAAHTCAALPEDPCTSSSMSCPRRATWPPHAQACLLDHVAERQARLAVLTGATVTVDVAQDMLERADSAWSAQDQPPD